MINRKDFELNWNRKLDKGGLLVGNEVTIELKIQAVASTLLYEQDSQSQLN